MDPEVKKIFSESALSKDPNRHNVFIFVLSHDGRVVHEFHGLPGGRRGPASGRSDYRVEISKAIAQLGLSDGKAHEPGAGVCRSLPDLKAAAPGVPAGVRIFVRQDDPSNSHYSNLPVVEVVPMKRDEWNALSFTPEGQDIDAEVLKNWLVWLYPAGIRTADQTKPFQRFRGTLRLKPAASDETFRYALLSGAIRLAKETESDADSTFEGTLQAVLSYRLDRPEVHSLRAVVEGVYLYRMRGTSPQQLRVAIESRPE